MITMEIAKPKNTCVPCDHKYEPREINVRPPRYGPYIQLSLVCGTCHNYTVTEEMRKHNVGQSNAMFNKG